MMNMNRMVILLAAAVCAFPLAPAAAKPRPAAAKTKPAKEPGKVTYKLKYTEDFRGRGLNPKMWKRIDRGDPDWKKNMSLRDDLIVVTNGIVSLLGIRNDGKDPAEKRSVLTGGIMTKDLYTMQYGKVEIRAKLEDQKGAWPAIWMLPQKSVKGWPHDGEIDIIERLNSDDFVYQTVHTGWKKPGPEKGGKGKIKVGDWNVYGLEWTPEEIVWTVNGKRCHGYRKTVDDPAQYPWTVPFYLMIDMQLGGKWVGAVNEATLPVAMHVDWVKFYDAYRGGKKISTLGFMSTERRAKPKSPGK